MKTYLATKPQCLFIANLLFQDSDYKEIQNLIPGKTDKEDKRQLVLSTHLQKKINRVIAGKLIDQLLNEETEQVIGTFKHLLKDINKNEVFTGEHEMQNWGDSLPEGVTLKATLK